MIRNVLDYLSYFCARKWSHYDFAIIYSWKHTRANYKRLHRDRFSDSNLEGYPTFTIILHQNKLCTLPCATNVFPLCFGHTECCKKYYLINIVNKYFYICILLTHWVFCLCFKVFHFYFEQIRIYGVPEGAWRKKKRCTFTRSCKVFHFGQGTPGSVHQHWNHNNVSTPTCSLGNGARLHIRQGCTCQWLWLGFELGPMCCRTLFSRLHWPFPTMEHTHQGERFIEFWTWPQI